MKTCNKTNCINYNEDVEACYQCINNTDMKNNTVNNFRPKPKKQKDKREYVEYWMIHCGHSMNGKFASSQVFNSEKDANAEATHLALENPDKAFYVLKTVGVFKYKVEKAFMDFRMENHIEK